jgi:uridine kinase
MFFIGVSGASSSGKTTLSRKIMDLFGEEECYVISQDNFYKNISPGTDTSDYNFDCPEAIDFISLKSCINNMLQHKRVKIPQYDFSKHTATYCKDINFKGKCLILEGIFSLLDDDIKDKMDLKIFVDTDLDICLTRRLLRDVEKRGRTMMSVLNQYKKFVKPSYYKYIIFEKQQSDIIIPNGGENLIALNIINQYINSCINR